MAGKPTTVEAYLASLPEDRRSAINAVRKVILKSLDAGYEEGISYGMISYCVPHRLYPAGYHCDPKQPLPFAVLGSQKNYMSLHLMCLYSTGDPHGAAAKLQEWFETDWAKTGKKLDMGKACVRFRKADDLALGTIAKLFEKVPAAKWIAANEKFLEMRKSQKPKKTASRRQAASASGT
jgi:hypothetical protein